MSIPLARRAAVAVILGVTLSAALIGVKPAGAAPAQTSETITPSLAPDRLRAKGALTLTIHYSGGDTGVPSPVRRSLLKLPAGLGLDIPTLRSCSAARLRSHGASGCPRQAKIGSGQALVEALAGSQLITEHIALSIFLGPLRNFQPTFEVLGEGRTPLQKRVVFSGSVTPDHAPYGEELQLDIPPIPTLHLEPDASIAALTLTVGTNSHPLGREVNTVVVPTSCPVGGFPFAAETTYADGSTADSLATAACPP
jgi:hypothetical protein